LARFTVRFGLLLLLGLAISSATASVCETPRVGDPEWIVIQFFRCRYVTPTVGQVVRADVGRLAVYAGPGLRIAIHKGRVWDVSVVSAMPTPTPAVSPTNRTVCSKGTIAELPVERQARWTDGAALGKPGYRCLHFSGQ
jgi:hypothetical protein